MQRQQFVSYKHTSGSFHVTEAAHFARRKTEQLWRHTMHRENVIARRAFDARDSSFAATSLMGMTCTPSFLPLCEYENRLRKVPSPFASRSTHRINVGFIPRRIVEAHDETGMTAAEVILT